MDAKNVIAKEVRHSRIVEAGRKIARVVTHVDPSEKIKRHRRALEKDLRKWLLFFGGESFYLDFSKDHLKVIDRIEQALTGGGLFAVAMPRGSGKSTIMKWATLYCLLSGKRQFVIIIAATADLAGGIIDFVKRQLQENDRLNEYYPHVTAYVRAAEDKALKAKFQLRKYDQQHTGLKWGLGYFQLPDLTNEGQAGKAGPIKRRYATRYPSAGGVIEAYGLTGAIRGRQRDQEGGKTIRPDFVLIDDPQNRESAESDSQTAKRERIITGDVLGLAGVKKKIAAVMTCTVIRDGDLASRFLDKELHPEWSGVTCKMITKFPKAQETLWKEYAILYRECLAESKSLKLAFDFYKNNREAMDKGAEVAWINRIRSGELSALHTAQNLMIETGDQFWAEYQNEPKSQYSTLYTLDARIIQSRVQDRPPGVVPDWAHVVVASTDINPSYALTTTITAFGANQMAGVLWYGLYKDKPLPVEKEDTEIKTREKIYQALALHGRQIAQLACRPVLWLIDGGGTPEGCVIQFAHHAPQICGLQALCAFGRGWRNYRPTAKTGSKVLAGEQFHLVVERQDRQWLIFNADYWREVSQKGWVSEAGSPGSCSLPRGNHGDFAEQVSRELLTGKTEVGGRVVWVWKTLPGAHDYGDCMTMNYVAAARAGIGTAGYVPRPQRRRETRKAKVDYRR